MLDIFNTILSLLGVLVAAFGFFFVSRQLRRNAHSDIYALAAATKRVFIEQPDMWPYFYDNQPVPQNDRTLENRVMAVADLYCLYLEQIALYADDLRGEKEAWMEFVQAMYRRSPAVRAWADRHFLDRALLEAFEAAH